MFGARAARLRNYAAVVLLVTGLAVGVAPSAASAAASCHWNKDSHNNLLVGRSSNCDGLYKTQTTCASSAWVVYSRQLRRPNNGPFINVWVQLWYSDACATAWAMIPSNGWPAASGTSGCLAYIIRDNTPDKWYVEPVDPGIDFAYTRMYFDQTQNGITVTSHAEASCDDGQNEYIASTPSW